MHRTRLTDDPAYLSTLLQRTVPGIGPVVGLERVAEGYGATTMTAAGGLTLRIPHSVRLAERQYHTAQALRRLAPLLPVPIPVPIWMLPISYPFETGILAYHWIEGEQLNPEVAEPIVASQIGSFLATLHGVDGPQLDDFDGRIPGPADVSAERQRVISIAFPWLRQHLDPPTLQRLERWYEAFQSRLAGLAFEPRIVHGDFWHGNMLVDSSQSHLVGVIDWENVALDDPAQDLATLLHGGPQFSDAVLEAYADAGGRLDTGTIMRRDLLWEFRELTGIALAVEFGDDAEAGDALRKLLAGPLRSILQDAPE